MGDLIDDKGFCWLCRLEFDSGREPFHVIFDVLVLTCPVDKSARSEGCLSIPTCSS